MFREFQMLSNKAQRLLPPSCSSSAIFMKEVIENKENYLGLHQLSLSSSLISSFCNLLFFVKKSGWCIILSRLTFATSSEKKLFLFTWTHLESSSAFFGSFRSYLFFRRNFWRKPDCPAHNNNCQPPPCFAEVPCDFIPDGTSNANEVQHLVSTL